MLIPGSVFPLVVNQFLIEKQRQYWKVSSVLVYILIILDSKDICS